MVASSTHPVTAGGYSRHDYPSIQALTASVQANINPLARAIEEACPGLSKWRVALYERTYDHAKEPTAPSIFDLLSTAPAPLLEVLPGLRPEVQALLYTPGSGTGTDPDPDAAGRRCPTLMDATGLVQLIKEGKASALQVVEASLARVAFVQQALGAYTEIDADHARARAKELDAQQARGEPLGALHGLPISVKCNMNTVGNMSTRCFVVDMLKPSEVARAAGAGAAVGGPITEAIIGEAAASTNCLTVEALVQAGAVVVAKTTAPTLMMQLDTRSPAFGQTLNAHNLALSPGGSSGGESASVASGATGLGLGSDIGGSIRQPAAVSALWGFRPSANRLPLAGGRDPAPGNMGVDPVCGPLARSLRDVQLFMSTVLSPTAVSGKAVWDLDFSVHPRPWAETFVASWLTEAGRAYRAQHGQKTKLVVGVERDDGVVVPQPPVRRALQAVADARRTFSARAAVDWLEVKELPCPLGDHQEAWDLIRQLYWADGAVPSRAMLAAGEETLDPLTEFILAEPHVPARPLDAAQVFQQRCRREAFKAAYWAAWDAAGIDVLLCPATVGVADRPEQAKYWGYTSVWNLLDYPALSFPSGVVASAPLDAAFVEAERAAGRTRGPYGRDDTRVAKEYETYKHAFDGAPVGLQLVAKRDEVLLRAAEVVDHAALQGHNK